MYKKLCVIVVGLHLAATVKDKMSEYYDNLIEDVKPTAEKITAKLNQAAELIAEAQYMAEEIGLTDLIRSQWTEMSDEMEADFDKFLDDNDPDRYDVLDQLYELIDVSKLETALGESGWNTSSSYC